MANRPNPLRFLELLGLGLRSARRDAAVGVVLVAIVVLASFGLSAAPRYVNAASDHALATAAAEASSLQRNVSFGRAGRIAGLSPDPFGLVTAQGEQLAGSLEGDLADSIRGSYFSVKSPQFELHHVPPRAEHAVNRYFGFRFQQGAMDSMRVSSGSLPSRFDATTIPIYVCEDGQTRFEPGLEICLERRVPLYQTAVTQETADWLAVKVGDRVLLDPVVDTPLNLGLPLSQLHYRLALEISGIVTLSDDSDETWMGDAGLHRPVVVAGGFEGFDVYATGWLAPQDYSRLLEDTRPSRFSYYWRFLVDYDRLTSSNIERVAKDVDALALQYETGAAIEGPRLFTDIDGIAADYRKAKNLTIAYSSLIVLGLSGLVLSVVIVLAALAARRREKTTILLRGRGASALRLGLARFGEGLVLFIPASLAGLIAAQTLVDGTPPPSPIWLAIAIAVVLALVYVILALPSAAGDLGRLMADRPLRGKRVRRLVIEAAIFSAAAGSILLIRRRGLEGSSAGFDPLLAAGPLLVALAAGVLMMRAVPYAARLASTFGSRARGVVGLVGFRSLARRSLPAQLPPLVLLVGVTIAVFGAVLGSTVRSMQEEGSWHTVGANYRIEPTVEGSRISPLLSLADVPGIEATADGVLLRAQVSDRGSNRGSIQTLGLDLAGYQTVNSKTFADPHLPNSMLRELKPEDVGTESNPIPAVVSLDWPLATPIVGQRLTLVIDHLDVVVVVEELRGEFPGLEVGRPFVILSREALGLANERIDVDPNRRYVRAADSLSGELDASLKSQQRGAKLVSRPSILTSIRANPVGSTVFRITQISILVAGILSSVAVVAGFTLTSRERNRDLGYLRAVGLSRGKMTWVTFTEQLPPATLATLAGALMGIVLMLLIGPALDLTPLTGTDIVRGPSIIWGPIAAVAAGLLGTVVIASAIYSYLNRDMDLAGVLRRGER